MRVTSTQADKLKELGYDGVVNRDNESSWVATPTVMQVIQWLVQVKNLFPTVAPIYDELDESESQVLWTAGVFDIDLSSVTSILTETHEYYHTHDEALLDAIDLAIELLTTLKR